MKTDSELTAKFSNIYINLLYCVMTKDLNKIRHYISDEVYNKYQSIIDELKQNNQSRLFDELNVGKIDIINKVTTDTKEIITVSIIARYMDYLVDENGEYVSGNNEYREEHENILVFEKYLDAETKNFYRCSNCGNNLDINYSGECPYCNKVCDISEYEYQLVSIETKE